jgi:altronate dehydratase large subunit
MNTSMGLSILTTTDMVAGGAQIMVYTTGGGNPLGSIIAPVLKVTATPATMDKMGENIDFDASPVLLGEESLEDCGQRLLVEFVAVASGKLVRAEELGNNLFGIGKVAIP